MVMLGVIAAVQINVAELIVDVAAKRERGARALTVLDLVATRSCGYRQIHESLRELRQALASIGRGE